MPCQVEVLISPDQSRSREAMGRYQAALEAASRDRRHGRTLWLAPHFRAQRQKLEQTLDGRRFCWSPQVFTFDSFAERLLQTSSSIVTPLSGVLQRTILRRIIERLHAKGELKYFANIAGTSGFLDVVVRLIAELKRDEVWPEEFKTACDKRSPDYGEKDCAILGIYEAYQNVLHEHGWYDTEGRLWLARSLMAEGNRGPFRELDLVVVDGFTSFTYTQYEMLGYLATWTDKMLITLPLEEPMRRPDVFALSSRALDKLCRHLGSKADLCVKAVEPDTNISPAGIRHVGRHLFSNPREIVESDDAAGIEVVAATGPASEMRALSLRVKEWLLAGVSPGDIVVGVRDTDGEGRRLAEHFRHCGIPVICDGGPRLIERPLARAVLQLLSLELHDWSYDALHAVLDSASFRPRWGGWWKERSARSVMFRLRQLRVTTGRTAILQSLRRNADRLKEALGEAEETTELKTATLAYNHLHNLSETLSRLRTAQTFAEWVNSLTVVARACGLAPSPGKAEAEAADIADRDDWELLQRTLRSTALADAEVEAERRISLAAFFGEVVDILSHERGHHVTAEQGRVRILNVVQVRGLDVAYLCLPGLTEQNFPSGRADDCLYSDRERAELAGDSVELTQKRSHLEEEVLLFHSLATLPSRRLYLSYSAINARGQSLFPSPYLSALQSLFRREALTQTYEGSLDPVPEKSRMHALGEARLVAVTEARDGRAAWLAGLMTRPDSAPMGRNLLANLRLSVQRFHERGFTPYEGRLQKGANVEALRKQFGTNYPFSVTSLEEYALCPFKFWLRRVLKVMPVESLEVGTDHLTRGILLHQVLAQLNLEQLLGQGEERMIATRFRELVTAAFGESSSESALQQSLRRIEEELLADWAGPFAAHQRQFLQEAHEKWGSVPGFLKPELAFGNVPEDAEEGIGEVPAGAATQDEYPPLRFGKGRSSVQVGGKIDRIDHGRLEDGTPVYAVIDYKTGSVDRRRFQQADIATGRALQLALYVLAVKRLGILGEEAVPYQMGYWSLKGTGFVAGLKGEKRSREKGLQRLDTAVLEAMETILEETIPRLAEGIRSGEFVVDSLQNTPSDNCTGSCEYRMVCRVNQVRPLADSLGKRRDANTAGASGEVASSEGSL